MSITLRSIVSALAVALVVTTVGSAHAELPTVLESGGAKLTLNGSGVRSKYLMKMYVAGLYLTKPSKDAKAIVAADEPMAIRLEITSGMVTQEKLLESLNEGFQKATGGKPEPIQKEIDAFRQALKGTINKGDVIDLVYLPGRGVNVSQNGKQLGVTPRLEFKQALFGIWLSENPADATVKRGLLMAQGGATATK